MSMGDPLTIVKPPHGSDPTTGSIQWPADLPSEWVDNRSDLDAVTALFPMKISGYLRSQITSPDDPLGRQVIPHVQELQDIQQCEDPLAEEKQSPAAQVIHRYPHRVVFLVSNQCAVHCRFCMRKRRVSSCAALSRPQLDQGLDYISKNARIKEVILSGGDPLMLNDPELAGLLKRLHAISHVQLLRIHTRVPVVLPQRVSPQLAAMVSDFQPIFINVHINHPMELTSEAATALAILADAGIALGSQTVLLKGVNDTPEVLAQLFETLLRLRVRPYYLHQLDRVPGTAHFQVPIEKGLELMQGLRGRLSGMAIPHFAVDLPGGGGKVALTPETIVEKGTHQWRIKNWKGDIYTYPIDKTTDDLVPILEH